MAINVNCKHIFQVISTRKTGSEAAGATKFGVTDLNVERYFNLQTLDFCDSALLRYIFNIYYLFIRITKHTQKIYKLLNYIKVWFNYFKCLH